MAVAELYAREGDTVDALVWRERGLGPADLGNVLEANPGLGAIGAILPAGTLVAIPARAPASPIIKLTQLWD